MSDKDSSNDRNAFTRRRRGKRNVNPIATFVDGGDGVLRSSEYWGISCVCLFSGSKKIWLGVFLQRDCVSWSEPKRRLCALHMPLIFHSYHGDGNSELLIFACYFFLFYDWLELSPLLLFRCCFWRRRKRKAATINPKQYALDIVQDKAI